LYHLFNAQAEKFDLIFTESLWLSYQVNCCWNADGRGGTPWDCEGNGLHLEKPKVLGAMFEWGLLIH